MPIITFYEIDLSTTSLPKLSEVEGVIFDYINDQGAASQRGAFRIARNEGYSQGKTAAAIGSLVNRGILSRRNLTVEMDEMPS